MAAPAPAGESITSLDPLPAPPAKTRRPAGRREGRGPESRYDAAQTTDTNRRHWAWADHLSANAANTPWIRRQLRNRSRYERANNGYIKGLIRARTNDTIGTGPRLQLDLPDAYLDPEFGRPVATGTPDQAAADLARAVEKKWCEWADATGLADKLRVMADAEDTDGETFCLFVSNPRLDGVRLDLRVIECDRVATPGVITAATPFDGVVLDELGNPLEYYVLRQHPGDYFQIVTDVWAFDRVPAEHVVHLFDQERPEQARGVPLMTPALPLYAILRRYTLANLLTAEAQARINAVIEQENALAQCDPADPEADSEDGAGEQIYFAGTQMLTLSAGQKALTLQPSAPGPSYREFKSEVLTEAGRAAGENRNTATGSSAEYNYSSGRLDHLPRLRGIRIRRDRFERRCLDRVFRAWLAEALLVPGYLPAGLPPAPEWRWCWQWDAFESIDPVKDATAQEIRKRNGLATDADELAAAGKDWREHYRQLAREKSLRDELGLTPAPAEAAPGKTSGVPGSVLAGGGGDDD